MVGRAEIGELFDRLVDPEVGLCAHESRFGEAQVVEAVAAWGARTADGRRHRGSDPVLP